MENFNSDEFSSQPPSFLAKFYDLVPTYGNRKDIDFYKHIAQLAKSRIGAEKILEIGCGTGRILIPLAKDGHEISGLDLSNQMLEKCKEKLSYETIDIQNRVKLFQGSMTDFQLNTNFDLITAPFHCYQHLISEKEQLDCFKSINSHLTEGGLFVFDLSAKSIKSINNQELPKEKMDFSNIDIGGGIKLSRTKRTVAFYDKEQYWDIELIFDISFQDGNTERMVYSFPYKYFSLFEIKELLDHTGFEIENIYGNYDLTPFNDNSSEMIIVSRKIKCF